MPAETVDLISAEPWLAVGRGHDCVARRVGAPAAVGVVLGLGPVEAKIRFFISPLTPLAPARASRRSRSWSS